MTYRMIALGIALAALPVAAYSQLVSETVEDNQRICRYASPKSFLTGSDNNRVYRTSVGQNCPATFPVDNPHLSLPPTARLDMEITADQVRRCRYEQAGATWWRSIPIAMQCPLHAGLLSPQVEADGRR